MNVVDTSGWLEYFADGTNAAFFAPAIEDTEHLIVPVICIYGVLRKYCKVRVRLWRSSGWQTWSRVRWLR